MTARIWCGYRSDYEYDDDGRSADRPDFLGSVRLDLAEPHLIVPANTPPEDPYVLLPYGNALQVTGEEAHLETLTPWLRSEGEGWIYVTLHEVLEQTTRSVRAVVEVRVNGSVGGTLTPKMSGEYLPVIRMLAEQGTVAAARAILKGNRIKADIVLHAARANQLSGEWLDKIATQPSAPADDNMRSARRVPELAAAANGSNALTLEAIEEPGTWRFNPPPGWPPAPLGWTPSSGWRPDPSWPAAPPRWLFWLPQTLPAGAFGTDPPPWS
ncbi:hypothetical protein [Dactylosporangium sp. NPDC051541]|uniref:hypothetical protein n=1 Tax=Dactylosporangium sp. NPDC051541 TaxID=3363977 RepID=UPI0037B655B0